MDTSKGITLIGMSGSGKSTIGQVIAERLNMPLIDVDRWIEKHEGMPLAEVIERKGDEFELNLEMECIKGQSLLNTIVSPPGSVIYTDAYDTLAQQTHIVWLNVPHDILRERIMTDPERQRLILGLKEKGVDGLLNERIPLYNKWADYTIDCADKTVDQVANEVIQVVYAGQA